MWPFSVKKIGKRSIDENRRPDLQQLIDRDHIHELDKNDAELRVWLPELCKQALDETVESGCTTAARYLRELFVVYLYGEHELRRMREKDTGIYYKPPPLPQSEEPGSGVMFSIMIQLHLELEDEIPLIRAHGIAKAVEKEILRTWPEADIIIHQDPAHLTMKTERKNYTD